MSYEHFSIEPVNRSPDNVYGHSKSNNTLQFSLPSANKFVIGDSLRLCFKFQVRTSAGAVIAAANVSHLSAETGINSIISSLEVGSYENGGLSIEQVRQYPKMVASLLTNGFGDRNSTTGRLSNSGCGYNLDYMRWNIGNNGLNTSYQMKLYSGFLMGNNAINLSPNNQGGVGGIRLTCNLNSDSFVLSKYPGTANTGMTYEISDVILRGVMINPSQDEVKAGVLKESFTSSYMNYVKNVEGRRVDPDEVNSAFDRKIELSSTSNPPPMNYNTINGYLHILNTNNNAITSNIGLGNCISCFGNMVLSSYINNYNFDSGALYFMDTDTPQALPFENIRFSRGGLLEPLAYDEETSVSSNYVNQGAILQTETMDTRGQIYRTAQEGVYPFGGKGYEGKVQGNIYYGLENDNLYRNSVGTDLVRPKNAIFGVRFSSIEGNGVSYIDKPLQINIDSKNLAGNNQSYTLFLYVVNRQSLVFENGTMRVVS